MNWNNAKAKRNKNDKETNKRSKKNVYVKIDEFNTVSFQFRWSKYFSVFPYSETFVLQIIALLSLNYNSS